MHKSPWEITKEWWEEVRLKVNHAIVFMDKQMAELLHWSGGIGILLSAGALDIREFSAFESGNESQKKGVFIISTPLSGAGHDVMHDIVTQSQFQYVIVMTTASPLLHLVNLDNETGAFEEFEELVLHWMGNMNYTVEVIHIPFFAAEVCPGLFIAPTCSSIFPFLSSDVKQIAHQYSSSHPHDSKSIETLEDIELHHLPDNLQLQVRLLASGLHFLLQGMDVKEDIYSMGNTSRLVANTLDAYPPAKARRKAVQSRASLVLIDRTLDIASAITHQLDTLMDKVSNTLPSLSRHSSDRQIDLQSLTNVARNASTTAAILPGSLSPSDFTESPTHLLSLFTKKYKEALMDVNRKLVEAASVEKLPLNLTGRPGRVTVEQIDSIITLFKGNYSLVKKHLDTLQVSMATSQALKHPLSSHLDNATVTEKNLIQTIAEVDSSVPSGVSIITRLIQQEMDKPKNERSLSLDDILCLTTYMYAIAEGDCGAEDETKQLRDQLVKWIIKDSEILSPLVQQIVGDRVTESILTDQIESVWDHMMAVAEARDRLQQFQSVLDPGDSMTPASVKPLLRQIMEKIVDPAKPDLPDIEYKSGGFKDLLKSGFGFFKGSGKPRPGDAPLLLIFVIGGITAGEVKQIRDVIEKAKPQFEVVVGSTKLASIASTLESVLVADNINIVHISPSFILTY